MTKPQRFRILTVEGVLSYDTFVIGAQQPTGVIAGCLVVVNEQDGRQLTVHRTRLVPVGETPRPSPPKTACMECGRVEGVVKDEVVCPHHGGVACGLLKEK